MEKFINHSISCKPTQNRNQHLEFLTVKTQEKTQLSLNDEYYREQYTQSECARFRLQQLLSNSEASNVATITKLVEEKQKLINEKVEAQRLATELTAKIGELQENLRKQPKYEQEERTITIDCIQPSIVEQLQNEISKINQQKQEIYTNYQQFMTTASAERENFINANKQLTEQQIEINNKNNDLAKDMQNVQCQNTHITKKCNTQEQEIKDLKETIKMLQNQLSDKETAHIASNQMVIKFTTVIKQMQSQESAYKSTISKLQEDIVHAKEDIKQRDLNYSKLNESLQSNNALIEEAKDNLCQQQAIASQNALEIESLKDQLKCYEQVKDKHAKAEGENAQLRNDLTRIQQEYESLSSDFNAIADQSTKTAQDSQSLIGKNSSLSIENKEHKKKIAELLEEIIQHKDIISALQAQIENNNKFLQVQDDPIDQKLKECLNKYTNGSNSLDIAFVRQSKGVYIFGTQKILLKMEFDQLIVRVGGGYCTLDEFLKIHTPIELEKLKKSNVMKSVCAKIERVNKSLVTMDDKLVSPRDK